MFFFLFGIEELFAFNGADFFLLTLKTSTTLYVQEVVTLQKKIFNIFASENEVYTLYTIYQLLRYFRLNNFRLQSKMILGHINSIG